MGAQLWYRAAPWFPDPADALRALQARWLAENVPDLADAVRTDLEWTRQVVQRHEAERDRYGLLDMYRRKVALLEDVCRQGVAKDVGARVALFREINRLSGAEGVGGVMDVTATSPERGHHRAEVLTLEEIARLVGFPHPTRRQAEAAVFRINEELERGECVCFPIYTDETRQEPIGWYFVGNTID